VILAAARIAGPTSRPRWRSSILGSPTRSNSFAGVPNHAISPARVRDGHGSCGKRSADSAFPTSSHSRCYGIHINEPARRGTSERSGRVVKSSVHETTGGLTTNGTVACPQSAGIPQDSRRSSFGTLRDLTQTISGLAASQATGRAAVDSHASPREGTAKRLYTTRPRAVVAARTAKSTHIASGRSMPRGPKYWYDTPDRRPPNKLPRATHQ
jgi:hypothetical protein